MERKFLFLCGFLFFSLWFSQTISTHLQHQEMSLGGVNHFRLKIEDLQGKAVFLPQKGELLPFHFQVIKDSIVQDKDKYWRFVEFSIYEEGEFSIPQYHIKVGNQNFSTQSYQIKVSNPAQSGDVIHDIMNNKSTEMTFSDYWEMYKWYVLTIIFIIALIIIIVFLWRYAKKEKNPIVENTNLTIKKLNALSLKKYIEKEEYRFFYVEFIEIIREFLVKQYKVPADVLLTEDLILYMNENQMISSENEKKLAEVFHRADAVKFAKVIPEKQKVYQDFEEIKQWVKKSVKEVEFENIRKAH